MINVDNPRYLFTFCPDLGSDYIVIRPSAHIGPLIIHQATLLHYHCPNYCSFSYFCYQMADPNLT